MGSIPCQWLDGLPESIGVAAVLLAGVLQSLRDASDAGEQRFE